MRTSTLLARNLTWYLAHQPGGAAGRRHRDRRAGGALLVGDSVRASLRDLVLAAWATRIPWSQRSGFFREKLADELGPACPLIAMEGVAAHEPSGRRAAACRYTASTSASGNFRVKPGEPPRAAMLLLSAALARGTGSKAEIRFCCACRSPRRFRSNRCTAARRTSAGPIRLTMSGVAQREFSLRPQQGDVRAVYVPLARLQRELGQAARSTRSWRRQRRTSQVS